MTQANTTVETLEPSTEAATETSKTRKAASIDLTGKDSATATKAKKGTAKTTKAKTTKAKATKAKTTKATAAKGDAKTTKGAAKKTTRRRTAQTKKKHYTEDSIRLYLQEIGRIRLLRAEEEIELARKIADLLELERIRDEIDDQLDARANRYRLGKCGGYAAACFSQRRLHLGRRAKDKMVQSNLRLVVSIAKEVYESGSVFSGPNSRRQPGPDSRG